MPSGVSVWIERQLTLCLFCTRWYAVRLRLSVELEFMPHTVDVCALANCCHMVRVKTMSVSLHFY
jgi:hypothetical protein